MERRAAIDIGTNSVKLLVADVEGGQVQAVVERSVQTRLGGGFYARGELTAEAMARTAEVVAQLAREAGERGAGRMRAVATSVVREARNAAVFLEAVRRVAGIEVEVLSGVQEAEWAFRGVRSDVRLAGHPLLLLELGGGSCQFSLGEETPVFCRSYPMGALRLLQQIQLSDPPTAAELAACRARVAGFLADEVLPELRSVMAHARSVPWLAVTGGTASILGAIELGLTQFDRERLDGRVLRRSEVENLEARLWGLGLADRRMLPGLPPERADVILPGVVFYATTLAQGGFTALRLSLRGLRYAALMP